MQQNNLILEGDVAQNSEEKLFESYLNEGDRDTLLEGTIEGFRSLMSTNEWKDIKNALEGMLIQLQMDVMLETNMDTVKRIQGKALMLAFLHDMPEELIDELESAEQLKKESEEI